MTMPAAGTLSSAFPSGEWKDSRSPVYDAALRVARTQEEWEHMWNDVYGHQSSRPQAPLLPQGKMALGIFTGLTFGACELDIVKIDTVRGIHTQVHWQSSPEYDTETRDMKSAFLMKWVNLTQEPVVFREVAQPAALSPAPGPSIS